MKTKQERLNEALKLTATPAEGVPGLWDCVGPTGERFSDLTTNQVKSLAITRGWLIVEPSNA